jgi:hypothetical protein
MGKKIVVEAELRNLKVAYSTLKDHAQGLVLQLNSCEKSLQTTYN